MYNQYSSQSSSDSDNDNKIQKRQPRFFKHSGVKINTNRIYINLVNCHYQVLSQLADDLQLKVTSSKHNWDLYWTDYAIEKQQLFRLLDHQKINHFPGMYVLARKNCLAKGLMKMRKNRPEQYDFFPLTWTLPSQYNDLKIYRQQLCLNDEKKSGQPVSKTAFIVKPQASCQGKGIKITLQPQKMAEQCVVQVYISNPFLISGLKFDFRLYVLLAGCDPMRIYLYRQGLARFSTQAYNFNPTKKNLKKTMVHLTNYAINKSNPKFIFNKSANQTNVGHKRSFTAVMRALAQMNVDTFTLQQKINQIIVKTIISGQPFLAHQYNLSLPDNYANDMCFQILGFDILIDEKSQPYLLEVNHTPSFVADTPFDHKIKYNLIKDTITLMNINTQSKKNKVASRSQFTQNREQGKIRKYTLEEKHWLKNQEQNKRDYFQNSHLGNYQKIYPTEDKNQMSIYDDLLKISESIFRKQNIRTKQKSLPVFKKSSSVIEPIIKRHSPSKHSPPKQFPLIQKTTSQLATFKLKIPKISTQLSNQIQLAEEGIVSSVSQVLKGAKKSLSTLVSDPKSTSPRKKPMTKTLISLRSLQKVQYAKEPDKGSFQIKKQLQRTLKIKQGIFLQPKLLRLQKKPSKQPSKGIHYCAPNQQKLPMNYQRYILKHTQNKRKEKQS